MTFSTIEELRNYINTTFTANGVGDITGPETKDALIGVLDLLTPTLKQNLTVNVGAGQSVGGSDSGETFTQGTLLETVLRDILLKVIHPTYVAPTLSLQTDTPGLEVEAGIIISPILNTLFTQNDAGGVITRTLKRNTLTIASTFPYQDLNYQVLDGSNIYQAIYTYGQGPIKNNNLGDPDPIGRIPAGTINSNAITYNGRRKLFAGTPTSTPVDSTSIRALTLSVLNAQIGTQFTINIPAGATRVVFAYPASLPSVTSVKYVELSNSEIKSLFTETTILNVKGANNFTGIDYKLYTYIPVEPFQADVTYIVTI